jgi:hypothetical protein
MTKLHLVKHQKRRRLQNLDALVPKLSNLSPQLNLP